MHGENYTIILQITGNNWPEGRRILKIASSFWDIDGHITRLKYWYETELMTRFPEDRWKDFTPYIHVVFNEGDEV